MSATIGRKARPTATISRKARPTATIARGSGTHIVRDGLVAEYRFDEGSGQVLTDHSGNGYDGTLGSTSGSDASDPTWTSTGLSFTTDDFVSIPSAAWDLATTIQVAAVVDGTSGFRGMTTGGGSSTLSFLVMSASNHIALTPIGVSTQTESSDAVAADDPFLATAIIDDTADRLYLADQEVSYTKQGASDTIAKGNNPRIGAETSGGFFEGDMYYVLLYSRQLSQAEITQNYEALRLIMGGRKVDIT